MRIFNASPSLAVKLILLLALRIVGGDGLFIFGSYFVNYVLCRRKINYLSPNSRITNLVHNKISILKEHNKLDIVYMSKKQTTDDVL